MVRVVTYTDSAWLAALPLPNECAALWRACCERAGLCAPGPRVPEKPKGASPSYHAVIKALLTALQPLYTGDLSRAKRVFYERTMHHSRARCDFSITPVYVANPTGRDVLIYMEVKTREALDERMNACQQQVKRYVLHQLQELVGDVLVANLPTAHPELLDGACAIGVLTDCGRVQFVRAVIVGPGSEDGHFRVLYERSDWMTLLEPQRGRRDGMSPPTEGFQHLCRLLFATHARLNATPPTPAVVTSASGDLVVLGDRIGRGGFSDAYVCAAWPRTAEHVVVKILRHMDSAAKVSLEQEAALMDAVARRASPEVMKHLPRCVQVSTSGGLPSLAMTPYGIPLLRVMDEVDTAMDADEDETDSLHSDDIAQHRSVLAARVGMHVLLALRHAHAQHVVHRDVRLANVVAVLEQSADVAAEAGPLAYQRANFVLVDWGCGAEHRDSKQLSKLAWFDVVSTLLVVAECSGPKPSTGFTQRKLDRATNDVRQSWGGDAERSPHLLGLIQQVVRMCAIGTIALEAAVNDHADANGLNNALNTVFNDTVERWSLSGSEVPRSDDLSYSRATRAIRRRSATASAAAAAES